MDQSVDQYYGEISGLADLEEFEQLLAPTFTELGRFTIGKAIEACWLAAPELPDDEVIKNALQDPELFEFILARISIALTEDGTPTEWTRLNQPGRRVYVLGDIAPEVAEAQPENKVVQETPTIIPVWQKIIAARQDLNSLEQGRLNIIFNILETEDSLSPLALARRFSHIANLEPADAREIVTHFSEKGLLKIIELESGTRKVVGDPYGVVVTKTEESSKTAPQEIEPAPVVERRAKRPKQPEKQPETQFYQTREELEAAIQNMTSRSAKRKAYQRGRELGLLPPSPSETQNPQSTQASQSRTARRRAQRKRAKQRNQ